MYKHFSKAYFFLYRYFFSSQKQRTKNFPIQEQIKKRMNIYVCIRKCHYNKLFCTVNNYYNEVIESSI